MGLRYRLSISPISRGDVTDLQFPEEFTIESVHRNELIL